MYAAVKYWSTIHEPLLWTRSMDWVHQNVDRVLRPPIFITPYRQDRCICLMHILAHVSMSLSRAYFYVNHS